MKLIFMLIIGSACVSACASSGDLKSPKALPDNWKIDTENPERNYQYTSSSKLANTSQPPPARPGTQSTSLWSSSPRSLFGDRRASQLGDILTVVIEIDDEAQLQNSVTSNASSKKNLEVGSFFGLPELLSNILPAGASLSPAVDVTGSNSSAGNGNITRKEKLTLRLAARVNEVLPNGYLGLSGRQEIIVNSEVRHLQITGLIRTADITRLNTITYDKIAEARIFYGGRGQVTRSVSEKTGAKIINKIIPF